MEVNFQLSRIGTSARDDDLKRLKRENIPGPGQYSIDNKKGTAFKFGTEKRDKKVKEMTPGPGQYYIPCSMVDVPKYLTNSAGFNAQFRYV
jgi:hypothetical protein